MDAKVEDRARAAVKTLARLGVVRAAYLFGSHAAGTADTWSDIDIAAFIEGLEHWDIRRRATAMALVMEEAGSNVEAHLFPASALHNPPPATFAQHIFHHGTPLRDQRHSSNCWRSRPVPATPSRCEIDRITLPGRSQSTHS